MNVVIGRDAESSTNMIFRQDEFSGFRFFGGHLVAFSGRNHRLDGS